MKKLTHTEAATALGISPDTLKGWRWLKKGPAYQTVGRRVFYRMADIRRYLKSVTKDHPAHTDPDINR